MIEHILLYDQQMLWEDAIARYSFGNINPFARKTFSERQLFILGLQPDYEWGWKDYPIKIIQRTNL